MNKICIFVFFMVCSISLFSAEEKKSYISQDGMAGAIGIASGLCANGVGLVAAHNINALFFNDSFSITRSAITGAAVSSAALIGAYVVRYITEQKYACLNKHHRIKLAHTAWLSSMASSAGCLLGIFAHKTWLYATALMCAAPIVQKV